MRCGSRNLPKRSRLDIFFPCSISTDNNVFETLQPQHHMHHSHIQNRLSHWAHCVGKAWEYMGSLHVRNISLEKLAPTPCSLAGTTTLTTCLSNLLLASHISTGYYRQLHSIKTIVILERLSQGISLTDVDLPHVVVPATLVTTPRSLAAHM